MILSVSRRTDIPNYYSDWFLNRIKEGFLYVRNPINPRQVSKVMLSPEWVDCIVFWTKNPENMLGRLGGLAGYDYFFQFTLTGYGQDIEPGIPDKRHMVSVFQRLSKKIGRDRVVWRYDPILLNDVYTIQYHVQAFTEIAHSLCGYTDKVVISFLDLYAKTKRNMTDPHGRYWMKAPSEADMLSIAKDLAVIAKAERMDIVSCAEKIDLQSVGVGHGSCIDKKMIEKIIGFKLAGNKDKGQRIECGCMESLEVGAYNTCKNGCRYCYANHSEERVREKVRSYDPDLPLLCGKVEPGDVVTERKMKSLKIGQMSIFDMVDW